MWRYSRDRAAIALRWSWLCAQLTDLEMKIRQHSDLYLELTQTKGQVQLLPTAKSEVEPEPANHQGDRTEEEAPGDWLCSRARPLVLSEFRKRKLFQTTNMHTISKKAARPSNIKCGCQWPQVPCTLCTGRADPTAPRELAETMMPATRVALLDAGYHPVLSFASGECHIRLGRNSFGFPEVECRGENKYYMKPTRMTLLSSLEPFLNSISVSQ